MKKIHRTIIMYCVKTLCALSIFVGHFTFAQEKAFTEFTGEILDATTKKPLVFASFLIENTNISSVSNSEGKYALKVPKKDLEGNVLISFLGYKTKTIPLSALPTENHTILMNESVMALTEVKLSAPTNAEALVKETFAKRGENYLNEPTVMTAFYRETIKKRRTHVSLSEAVVSIYKTPYMSPKKDMLELYKARKSTDYSKLDTLALKLQGGPFNTLFVDLAKYPQYLFAKESMQYYNFYFDSSTRINNKLIYVVGFRQKPVYKDQLYQGKLYIDAENKILTSAVYSLNITDKQLASKLFVRKKPKNADVWPTQVSYRVDYREKEGKWYYGYSNVTLEFKINWSKRLFNSIYSMTCEMAITDWEKNTKNVQPKTKIKSSIILEEEAMGFTDPNFWGEQNIIEPEKSIESAIRKIKRQLKRAKSKG